MFHRVIIGLLAFSFAGCATQQPASNVVDPLATDAASPLPSPSTIALEPALTTQALPSSPVRNPSRAAVEPPASAAAAPALPQAAPKRKPSSRASISDALIVQQILKASRAAYAGSCGCPEDRDKADRRCGGRSAYSRAGGYSLYCYPRDIPQELIEQWRNTL